MKTGTIISTILAAGAGIGLMTVFVSNASPYMTIKEADGTEQNVHVVGKIVPSSLKQDSIAQKVSFQLEDESGNMPVHYNGPPMANLSTATQVVVIGKKKEGVFEAHQMLVKCPSKYEAEKKQST
jgi:cytochrome c-type biogenesis protein CcmE